MATSNSAPRPVSGDGRRAFAASTPPPRHRTSSARVTRRGLGRAGVLPGIVALAVGCVSGRGSGARENAGDRATAAATLAAAPASLEFWLPGRQADAEALDPFHRQFVEETPQVASVTVQLVPNETMMERLTGALAAGTPPDAARLKEYRLADLGGRGALLPLDALVAKDPGVRLADFTSQSVEGSRATWQAGPGRASDRPLLGLPDSHQMVVLFWNKDLLARAGVDPEAAPGTWDALRRAAQAVGGGGFGRGS